MKIRTKSSIILLLVMILILSACGEKTDNKPQTYNGGETTSKPKTESGNEPTSNSASNPEAETKPKEVANNDNSENFVGTEKDVNNMFYKNLPAKELPDSWEDLQFSYLGQNYDVLGKKLAEVFPGVEKKPAV